MSLIKPVEIIPDEDLLYRRIPPQHYVKEEDRVSSAAFRDPNLSVDWSRHITPEQSVKGFPNNHLAALIAKIPRALGQEVYHTPSLRNYAHSSIVGQKSTSVARKLANSCSWVIQREA